MINLLCLLLLGTQSEAADNLITSTTAIKQEVVRFGDEALEVLETPVDIKNYGFVGTLAVTGAVGLTYLFDADIRDKVQGIKAA